MEIILCGNKTDLEEERMISTDEGKDWAQEHNIIFFETSAKDNNDDCVDNAFQHIIQSIAQRVIKENTKAFQEAIERERSSTLKMEEYEETKKCC